TIVDVKVCLSAQLITSGPGGAEVSRTHEMLDHPVEGGVMSQLITWLAGLPGGLFLPNVALAATLLAGAGLLAARGLAGRAAPLRHAVLLATLLLLFATPLLVHVGGRSGIALLRVDVGPPPPVEGPASQTGAGPGEVVGEGPRSAARWAGALVC